jgi:hypothetical protein
MQSRSFRQGSEVEIGGGGVGAVPVETLLAGGTAQGKAPRADRAAAQAAIRRDAELRGVLPT